MSKDQGGGRQPLGMVGFAHRGAAAPCLKKQKRVVFLLGDYTLNSI